MLKPFPIAVPFSQPDRSVHPPKADAADKTKNHMNLIQFYFLINLNLPRMLFSCSCQLRAACRGWPGLLSAAARVAHGNAAIGNRGLTARGASAAAVARLPPPPPLLSPPPPLNTSFSATGITPRSHTPGDRAPLQAAYMHTSAPPRQCAHNNGTVDGSVADAAAAVADMTTMTAFTDDTIFSLSSGAGKSGVAVVRVSGPHATAAVAALIAPKAMPGPRKGGLRVLRETTGQRLTAGGTDSTSSNHNPSLRAELDRAVVLPFPGPRSFTGEDVVELHLHGGRAVVKGVLEALGSFDRLRPAAAGEFTKRVRYDDVIGCVLVFGLFLGVELPWNSRVQWLRGAPPLPLPGWGTEHPASVLSRSRSGI